MKQPDNTHTLACPCCGKAVAWGPASPFRPFCSERCRLLDLGAWAAEEHRIPGPELPVFPEDRD